MNIIEATNEALKKECCIKRISWNGCFTLKPTKLCYEVVGSFNEEEKRPRFWDSETEDIMADDWILTG